MKKGKIYIDVNDIIGKRLGKLEVISYEGYRRDRTRRGNRLTTSVHHIYKVKCDCGTEKLVRRNTLLGNAIKSCGYCCERGRFSGYKNENK